MVPVGYWVMEEALPPAGRMAKPGVMLPLSVNVSLLQLLHHRSRYRDADITGSLIASRLGRWCWRLRKAVKSGRPADGGGVAAASVA